MICAQAIERLVAGRTVLIIAHRLSTVQAADQIVVLDSRARCRGVATLDACPSLSRDTNGRQDASLLRPPYVGQAFDRVLVGRVIAMVRIVAFTTRDLNAACISWDVPSTCSSARQLC